jgi:hypothetical protein
LTKKPVEAQLDDCARLARENVEQRIGLGGAKEFERMLADFIKNPRRYGFTRCLCGRPPRYLALFEPTHAFAKRIGQPKGKQRLLLYALCQECAEGPQERVEQAIVRELGVQ